MTLANRILSVMVATSGLVLAAASTSAATIHVDQSALPGGDGQSWPTAFDDLQDALAVAIAGDQIWVAAGTYRPSDLPFAVRTATFALVDGVAMYGAFPQGGGDGTFAARDVTNLAFETVLSGDIAVQGDAADNAYHVVTAISVAETAVLDGFTITGGNANGSSAKGQNFGAGMNVISSSPSVTNCAFSGNTANAGGGMYNENANPTVSNCTFSGNSASGSSFRSGGGMYNENANPTVSNCTFGGNTAAWGGGMYNSGFGSSPTVTGCSFTGNSAVVSGGGLMNAVGSGPIVTNCTFAGNSASQFGGAMNISSNGIISVGTMINCAFIGNSASRGGAVQIDLNGRPLFINCTFCGNTATNGGAVGNVAAVTLTNCSFAGNLASSGGGAIYTNGGMASIVNGTFSSNEAFDGGAILVGGGFLNTLRNNVLWSNIASLGHELTVLSGATLTTSYSNIQDGLGAIHGEVGAIVNWNAGMIDTDPLFQSGPAGTWTASATHDPANSRTTFVNTAAGLSIDALVGKFLNPDATQALQSLIVANTATTITVWGDFASLGVLGAAYQVNDYRLTSASPCVDAGDDFSVPADVADLDGDSDTTERTPLDIDLNPRFADPPPPGGTGVPDPPNYPEIVDMGPFEFRQVPGDLDGDGDVDGGDFAVLLAAWGRCSGDPVFNADADFDGDGCITIADYQIWLQHYRAFIANPLASPPVWMMGDADWNHRVDLADFASLQTCLSEAGGGGLPCVVKFDFNGDQAVDQLDVAPFVASLTGP